MNTITVTVHFPKGKRISVYQKNKLTQAILNTFQQQENTTRKRSTRQTVKKADCENKKLTIVLVY
ncbi:MULTISPECIES: hypothetical protein [Niastella]|uniref:Arm DNA-binding domain-containing protein n=1 Tax=Niastella soli TaxID=2821487 RepID=A0ABS3YT74_9BACT|nr:hypothetical protein [Niastella soli]MBO9200998.1 hypothetical protein [Niastella soli]